MCLKDKLQGTTPNNSNQAMEILRRTKVGPDIGFVSITTAVTVHSGREVNSITDVHSVINLVMVALPAEKLLQHRQKDQLVIMLKRTHQKAKDIGKNMRKTIT